MSKKVAIISPVFPPYHGGMGYAAQAHAQLMAERGFSIEVYTPAYKRKPGKEKRGEYLINWVKPSFKFGNAARINLDISNADIIHLHFPFYGTAELLPSWKAKYPDKKFIVTYHMDPIAAGIKGIIFNWYARKHTPQILAAADIVVVSSMDYALANSNKDFFEKNKSKCVEIPFAVDTKRFYPQPKDEQLLLSNNINPNMPTVLFVGGMDAAHAFKDVDVLLAAFAQVQTPAQLILVGDGNQKKNFQDLAKKLEIKNNVFFIGSVDYDYLPKWYNTADVFVLPSRNRGEAFGLVLLEAMASGVVCIASNLPGVRTVLAQGNCGILTTVDDVDGLAKSITNVLQDIPTRTRLAQAGLDRVALHYQLNNFADATAQLYH